MTPLALGGDTGGRRHGWKAITGINRFATAPDGGTGGRRLRRTAARTRRQVGTALDGSGDRRHQRSAARRLGGTSIMAVGAAPADVLTAAYISRDCNGRRHRRTSAAANAGSAEQPQRQSALTS